MKRNSFFIVALVTCMALFLIISCSPISHHHSTSPAYRPNSEHAATFVKALNTSKVEVYPTIVRTIQETTYSEDSQQQVVSILNSEKVTSAILKTDYVDPGPLKSPPQWDIFVHDLSTIAESIKDRKTDTDYSLVMEIIFSPENLSVWGIHCFVLDHQGNNVFSFLLNSHHKLFIDAKLFGKEASIITRARLIEKATRVGITALIQQIKTPVKVDAQNRQGYTVTSQKMDGFDKKVEKIFVMARIHERLEQVVMHSLKHSLVSGFESNAIKATVKLMHRDTNDYAEFDSDIESFSPDALMYVDLDPLVRSRKDGYQAFVGINFKVRVINQTSKKLVWQTKGKVDYIQDRFFNHGNYSAHEGIRKEFAWHTTAAIVRTFVLDVNNHKSAPIYTVTEDRQLYGQRID